MSDWIISKRIGTIEVGEFFIPNLKLRFSPNFTLKYAVFYRDYQIHNGTWYRDAGVRQLSPRDETKNKSDVWLSTICGRKELQAMYEVTAPSQAKLSKNLFESIRSNKTTIDYFVDRLCCDPIKTTLSHAYNSGLLEHLGEVKEAGKPMNKVPEYCVWDA